MRRFLFLVFGISVLLAANSYGQSKPAPPKGGDGKVSVCKEIDDDWKCVGEAIDWPAKRTLKC